MTNTVPEFKTCWVLGCGKSNESDQVMIGNQIISVETCFGHARQIEEDPHGWRLVIADEKRMPKLYPPGVPIPD